MLIQLSWIVVAILCAVGAVNILWWYGEYGKNDLLSANLALWPTMALIGLSAFCLIHSGVVP